MVDNRKLRFQQAADSSAGAGPGEHGGYDGSKDPLVELARLIGVENPFAAQEAAKSGRAAARDADPHDRETQGQFDPRANDDLPSASFGYGSHPRPARADDSEPDSRGYLDDPEQVHAAHREWQALAGRDYPADALREGAGYRRDEMAEDDGRDRPAESYPDPTFDTLHARDDYAYADSRDRHDESEDRYSRDANEHDLYRAYRDDDERSRSGGAGEASDQPPRFLSGYDDAPLASAQRRYGYLDHTGGSEADEEPVSERKRGGLVAVLAVLGLAVLGTAGAFAYRSYVTPSSSGPPPIIKADTNPSKIVPPRPADPARRPEAPRDAAKTEPNERVIPREEQPLQLSEIPRASAPRTVPTVPVGRPAAAPNEPALPPSASAMASSQTPGGEPKRVRTVTIRPDAAGMDPTGNAAARQAGRPPAPQTPSRPPGSVTDAGPQNRPLALNASQSPFPPEERSPARPQPALAAVPPPTAPAALPVRQAARPAADANASGYFVQLSAQKSEDDAQASFRSLQGKFPNLLGDRSPVIRKKDLGTRGVYYGAQVGPFAGREDAVALCESLKSQGGTCIVQRN